MLLALNSLKLSAQSPPWRRNARPRAASPRRSSRLRASPANTIGGKFSIVWSTDSRSSLLGYSGSCSAFFDLQLSRVHFPGLAVAGDRTVVVGDGFSVTVGFLAGSAAWTAEMRRGRPPAGMTDRSWGAAPTKAVAESEWGWRRDLVEIEEE
ncbi:hypothetical protein IEQ34_018930 [Dendrobium chrysotoxum]|uniref:Uncharacterized protein n=1 Tax=Dendrobium chrysotoxum TaxID=161865 RepID=A0AAV7G5I0_DENCH|nr:hypothetical protein IEQ34_018930 [Dendrobium chrysotoxum]